MSYSQARSIGGALRTVGATQGVNEMVLISSWVGEDLQHPGGWWGGLEPKYRSHFFFSKCFPRLDLSFGSGFTNYYIMYLVGRAVIYNMVCKVHHQLQR